jgi:hypothetical protein
MDGKENNTASLPLGRPEKTNERRWPSPTPTPLVPAREDVGRLLRNILDRLDRIERRLEKIEAVLAGRSPP